MQCNLNREKLSIAALWRAALSHDGESGAKQSRKVRVLRFEARGIDNSKRKTLRTHRTGRVGR